MRQASRFLARNMLAAGAVLAVLTAGTCAQAQTQPVRLVVPFAAGGSADQIARLIGQSFTERLGTPVIVDNRAGAGGSIAAADVARSAADGKTLFMGSNGPLVINVAVYPKLSYQPEQDFVPVVGLVETPLLLVVRKGLPVKTPAELVALAKANPDKPLTMASASAGYITHLAGEFISRKLGFTPLHVSFRGSAPAMLSLIGGEVDIMYDALPTVLEHARSGAVRPLAVTGARRLPELPETPTLAELGLDIGKVTAWFGLVAPAKTPAEIVRRYNEAANAALAEPALKQKVAAAGFVPMGGSPGDFAGFIRSETERWIPVVRSLGVKAD